MSQVPEQNFLERTEGEGRMHRHGCVCLCVCGGRGGGGGLEWAGMGVILEMSAQGLMTAGKADL